MKPKPSPREDYRVVYREFAIADLDTSDDADTAATVDLPPQQQQIRIQATRKGRGGKTVTLITGFQTTPEKLTSLLKQLKAQCGAGGTIEDGAIAIQGDHTQKLLQLLQKQGYKAKISGG